MPGTAAIFGVFVIGLLMVLTPGPNMIYLVSRTITQGKRAGAVSLAGVALGFLVYLTATNLGLAAVFVAVPDLYLALRVAGACYLAWLAFKALRPGGQRCSILSSSITTRCGASSRWGCSRTS